MDVQQLRTTLAAANSEVESGEWSDKPAIPASTVEQANESEHLMWVEITGGTVTVVKVDGVTTGRTSGAFFLRPGATISITYSVVPTSWKWFPLI